MRKLLILIPLLLLAAYAVGQTCNGSSPTWTAATGSAADVQACFNKTLHCGDTITVPSDTKTWSTQLTLSPPSGCPAFTGTNSPAVTVSGGTVCTGGCGPQSEGVGLAFTDSTNITTSVASQPTLLVTGCSLTRFVRITGFSFTNTTGGGTPLNGALNLSCAHGQIGGRVDHIHVTNNAGVFLTAGDGYGLVDHVLYTGGGTEYTFSSFVGDFASHGYLNWQDATNLGNGEAWIIEDSNFTHSGTQATTDGYFGCKITIRHNQINGGFGAGITHGLDSGGYRSCVDVDIYNNVFNSNQIGPPFGSRGGVFLFHDNVMQGASRWNGNQIAYFRASTSDYSVTSGWGLAPGGGGSAHPALSPLNWTPQTQGGNTDTLNASAYQTGHAYSASDVATLSSGGPCNVQVVVGGTSGGSAPTCPAFGSTVTDSGGVIWLNVGGTTSAGPGGTGFLSTDNETTCTSGVNCTRYLDGAGGYPLRDQPGTLHGQTVYGDHQWNNTGSQTPANWWDSDSAALQLNRDYFSAAPTGYTSYAYPDPLQGAPSGPVAASFQFFPIPTAVRTAAQGQVLVCKPTI